MYDVGDRDLQDQAAESDPLEEDEGRGATAQIAAESDGHLEEGKL